MTRARRLPAGRWPTSTGVGGVVPAPALDLEASSPARTPTPRPGSVSPRQLAGLPLPGEQHRERPAVRRLGARRGFGPHLPAAQPGSGGGDDVSGHRRLRKASAGVDSARSTPGRLRRYAGDGPGLAPLPRGAVPRPGWTIEALVEGFDGDTPPGPRVHRPGRRSCIHLCGGQHRRSAPQQGPGLRPGPRCRRLCRRHPGPGRDDDLRCLGRRLVWGSSLPWAG